jgi:DNA (cytosine-5)-methyltransferase 1
MLEPHEIQAAMAFPRENIVLGNRHEKVKQLGNAVTAPVMKLLMQRCLASLA